MHPDLESQAKPTHPCESTRAQEEGLEGGSEGFPTQWTVALRFTCSFYQRTVKKLSGGKDSLPGQCQDQGQLGTVQVGALGTG